MWGSFLHAVPFIRGTKREWEGGDSKGVLSKISRKRRLHSPETFRCLLGLSGVRPNAASVFRGGDPNSRRPPILLPLNQIVSGMEVLRRLLPRRHRDQYQFELLKSSSAHELLPRNRQGHSLPRYFSHHERLASTESIPRLITPKVSGRIDEARVCEKIASVFLRLIESIRCQSLPMRINASFH